MGRATTQLLGAQGPLRPLWVQPQEASPAACWLWETAVVLAAGGIEAGGFKRLRDRSLRGLQKPVFISVGFAAVLCHQDESTPFCGLHKQWLTALAPPSPWSKPVPAMAPTAAQGVSRAAAELLPEPLSWVWGGWWSQRGETQCCTPFFHRAHTLQGAGNDFAMERPRELFETKLQENIWLCYCKQKDLGETIAVTFS